MKDEVKTRGVLDFFARARALRESRLVDKRTSPSVESPINDSLYPLARPYFISLDNPSSSGYSPNDDGPGAA